MLAIAECLAQADPGNANWQQGLLVAHNKIGDVRVGPRGSGGAPGECLATLAWPKPIGATRTVASAPEGSWGAVSESGKLRQGTAGPPRGAAACPRLMLVTPELDGPGAEAPLYLV